MIKKIFILTILICLTVISQENHDDIVSVLIDGTQQRTNTTCFCTEDEKCDSNTQTCRLTHLDHACYESWTKEPNDDSIHVTAGCVLNEFFFTKLFCSGNQTNRYIICCSDHDYCNDRDAYSSDIRNKLLSSKKPKSDKFFIRSIFIIIIIIASILLLCTLFVLILFHIKRKKKNSSNCNGVTKSDKKSGLWISFLPRLKRSVSSTKSDPYPDDISKISDECNTLLLGTTRFSNQVTLEKKIGIGAYGTVYCGKWHQDTIAIKICLSNEEPSWRREVNIYEEFGLNHENVLRYIAADNTDVSNRIELWLGTEYHENGSVYDYLMTHTITIPIMIKMMFTIANGLFYLHVSIDATNGKPALAHRDLKTKNILVKKDLSCCIADLGLAVSEVRQKYSDLRNDNNSNNNEEHNVIDIKPNHRVGTIRYMAPEILDKTLNEKVFESYKATDLYALGLVFWEILRRCQTTPEENDADIYKLPYEDVLPNNPKFEEMHEVVCIRKIRPAPSPRWENNSTFCYILNSCQELWAENPACRPSTYVIKEQLRDLQNQ